MLQFMPMDFALVAPDLSMPAPPPGTMLTIGSNDEWIQNWLEASPPIDETGSRPAAIIASNFGIVMPEWLIGAQPAETQPAVASEIAIVDSQFAVQTEPIPEATEDLVEALDREHEKEPDEQAQTVTQFVSTWVTPTVSADPQPTAQKANRSLQFALRRKESAEQPQPTKPIPADKGELIWEAALVAEPPPVNLSSQSPPAPDCTVPKGSPSGFREVSAAPQLERKDWGAGERDEETPPAAAEPTAKRKWTSSTGDSRAANENDEPEPSVGKPAPELERHSASSPAGLDARALRTTSVDTTAEPSEGSTAAVPVAPAQRLHPTQVARVQVDIRVPGEAPGETPAMRLVLAQRGENVSVQLRSWNESAVPLPASDVQPLLEHLAKQGLVPAETGVEPAGAIEAPKDHSATLTPPAASQHEEPGFQSFDERQRRQHEQHRQQQEVFARRLPRPGAAFNLQSEIDGVQTR